MTDLTPTDDVNADERASSVSVGSIVAMVGGVAAVIGSLLDMVKVAVGSIHLDVSTSYVDTDNGKIVVALGAVVLILSAVLFLRPHASVVVPMGIAAAGLATLALAFSDRLDLRNLGDDYRADNHIAGVVHVTIGPALYVVMAGGLIATVGAVLASRDR
jgi:hypothetical protein